MKHPLDDLLMEALPPGSLFAVGGRVRDEIRSIAERIPVASADLDYVVTGVSAPSLVAVLERLGRVNVVGASFSVVKLQTAVGYADVALPRRERSTGVGHRDFTVEAGPQIPLEDDLRRRDFRMNMLARSIATGEVTDPYGGAADIRARRIDIVTEATFEEDPLRVLRAAQFAARFEYAVAPRAVRAMRAAAPLVASVSAERIGAELLKFLVPARRPSLGLWLLRDAGVLDGFWPELSEGVGVEQNEWHAFDVFRHNLECLDAAPPGDAISRVAAVLHDVGKPRTKDGPHFYRHEHVGANLVPAMLDRLRLSNATVTAVAHLVRHHMYAADPRLEARAIRRFIRRIGVEHLERLFALRACDIAGSGLPKRDGENELFEAKVRAILAERPAFTVRDLAVDGSDILDLLGVAGTSGGRRGDPRVGSVLAQLFERVTDEPELNQRKTLLALAKTIVPDAARMNAARDDRAFKDGARPSEIGER